MESASKNLLKTVLKSEDPLKYPSNPIHSKSSLKYPCLNVILSVILIVTLLAILSA